MKKRNLIPFNIQFFAEGSAAGSSETGSENAGAENSGEGAEGQGGQSTESQARTFTQEEVTAMMAKEKRQGKSAAIKALGFKSEQEAQNAIKLLNTLLDSQKSPEEKAGEGVKKAEDAREAAERRAAAAENKLSCLTAGVSADSIDDVLAIALLKVTEDKKLDSVLAEMKKEKKYSSFFGSGNSGDDGTGTEPGHAKSGSKKAPGEYGRELAKIDNGAQKKSHYF